MNTIIMVDEENRIIDAEFTDGEISIKGENIYWNGGQLIGMNGRYIIVDGHLQVNFGEVVPTVLVERDRKEDFIHEERVLEKEIDVLKMEIHSMRNEMANVKNEMAQMRQEYRGPNNQGG